MNARTVCKRVLARLPLVDGLFRRFIWSRLHFPEIEMRFLHALPPGAIDVAVDVGAALGSYSWILSRASRTVYAFEPGKLHNKFLSRVVSGSNVEVICAAVGSTTGQVNLYTPGSDSHALHSATVFEATQVVRVEDTRVERVQQTTLDAFLAACLAPGRTVDVLKVDVEGYELDVLKGAWRTLTLYHPLIICEVEARHNANYAEVFRLLKELGYSCYFFRDGTLELLLDERIERLQQAKDLAARIGGDYDPASNRYVNNFVFQHTESRIKVTQ
jgi:FkbM family methyltransferase